MNMLGEPSRDNMCGFVITTVYEKLKAENEKLREMIHMAEECMSYPHCVEECQYHYVKDGYWECKYQDLKDELKIKVE